MSVPRPSNRRKFDRLLTPGSTPDEIACHTLCTAFDRAARDMDRKWGVDRLTGLVSSETAAKWATVLGRLNAALNADNPDAVKREVEIAVRGFAAMDREAEAAGHKPANPDLWQIEHDGKVYVFIRDAALWPAAQAAQPGAQVYTLQEAIVALRGLGAFPDAVKAAFPGAQIADVRKRSPIEEDLNDEIPW